MNRIDSQNHISIYQIEDELLEKCRSGRFDFNLEDLKRLSLENFETLEDNPLHLILSHGSFTDDCLNAVFLLVKLFPDLLKIADVNDETPIDILHKNSQVFAIEYCLKAAYPYNKYEQATCLCYAKYAKELLEKFDLKPSAIVPNNPSQNPVLVCRKIGKEHLIPVFQKLNSTYYRLEFFINWRDFEGIRDYLENNTIDSSEIENNLSKLVEIGYDEKFIDRWIEFFAGELTGHISLDSKKFLILLQRAPQLIKTYPKADDLLYVFKTSFEVFGKSPGFINHIDTMMNILMNGGLFDLSYINHGDLFLPHLIPDIYLQNRDLAETLIKEHAFQGYRDSLFVDLCSGLISSLMDVDEFFQWILPLFKKEKIPVQFSSGNGLLMHGLAEFTIETVDRNIMIFKQLEKLFSKKTLCNQLKIRDSNNCLPIDCLIQCDPYDFEDDDRAEKATLLKLFLGLNGLPQIDEPEDLRKLIFFVLLHGDDELDQLVSLDNVELLIKLKSSEQPYKKPFFSDEYCTSMPRILKFLKFMVSLPKETQQFLLSDAPWFPFEPGFLLTHILENNDKEALSNFTALGGKFGRNLLRKLAKREISLEILKQILASEGPVNKKLSELFNFEHIDGKPPAIKEVLIDYYRNGWFACNVQLEPFYEYLLSKIGSPYRGVELEFKDGTLQIILEESIQSTNEGYHTQKAIDEAIDFERRRQNTVELSDTKALKSHELKEFSSLVYHEKFPTDPRFCIVNDPKQQKFIVNYGDYTIKDFRKKEFPYDFHVLDEVKEFVRGVYREFNEGWVLLKEAFPDLQIFVEVGSVTYTIENIPLIGMPSVESMKSELEIIRERQKFEEEIKQAGFITTKRNENSFSKNFQLLFGNKWFIEKLRLLVIKNHNSFYFMHCHLKNAPSYISTIESATGFTLNYEKAKSIHFKETPNLIHDKNAEVDINLLNASYQESDETARTALRNLVSRCKEGKKLKELSIEDSQVAYIQLTHTFKKLKTDQEQLRRFVNDLARDATLCGWRISSRISYEYKLAFNLFESDVCELNLDSLLTELYKTTINETIQTMVKCVQHPFSLQQTIHVGSFLRKCLKDVINLPPDLVHGNTHDRYTIGEDDYPLESVLTYFEAFFIPLLIERLVALQKEDHEAHALLMDALVEIIPVLDGLTTELENERDTKILEWAQKFEEADRQFTEWLASQQYIQNDQMRSERETVKNKIIALSCQWNELNKSCQDLENGVSRPNKKRKITENSAECLHIEKERILYNQAKINEAIAELKAYKKTLKKPSLDVESMKRVIDKLKKEKETIWDLYRAKIRWKIEEFCETEGYLISDEIAVPYITPKGAAKLLELIGFIK